MQRLTQTQIRDTSTQAYHTLVEPHLGERQSTVLDLLFRTVNDLTNAEIADLLDWPINCVTPRVYELRKMGFVEESRRRLCNVTRNAAYAWRVSREGLRKMRP